MTQPTIPADLLDLAAMADEELVPELQDCVVDDTALGMSMVQHPLVHDFLHLPGMLNRRLEAKKNALARALEERNVSTYIFVHERPYRFDALLEVREWGLTEDLWWDAVRDVWNDSNNTWQYYQEWYDLLDSAPTPAAGMMDEDERAVLASLPDQVTIWRGVKQDVNEDGFAWTLDQEQAEWFARWLIRDEHDPAVMEAVVDRGKVIAYLDGRGEKEILVMPENTKITRYYEIERQKEADG